jgi:hypothetical protein
VPDVPIAADIVDQHIDPRQALANLAGKSADLGLRGKVSNEHLHLPAADGTDLGSRGLGAFAVASGDRQSGTHSGQAERGRAADTAARTGHQHCLARHRPPGALFHVAPLVNGGRRAAKVSAQEPTGTVGGRWQRAGALGPCGGERPCASVVGERGGWTLRAHRGPRWARWLGSRSA